MINKPHGQRHSNQRGFPLDVHNESGHDNSKSEEKKTFGEDVVVEEEM